MAKKAKKSKKATTSRKTAAKKSSKSAAKKTATKSAAKKAPARPSQTQAAKTKNAARAAAARKPEPKKQASTVGTVAKAAVGAALLTMDAVARRMPWAKDQNDPIELLKTDHRHVQQLLKDGEATTERAKKGRREILDELTRSITVHEAIEERVFYPALQPHAEAHDLVLESFQEHHVADGLIKELHDVTTDDEQWGAKFKVLKENLEHHVSEEENKLFPIAKGVLKADELKQLGAKMRDLKAELEK